MEERKFFKNMYLIKFILKKNEGEKIVKWLILEKFYFDLISSRVWYGFISNVFWIINMVI